MQESTEDKVERALINKDYPEEFITQIWEDIVSDSKGESVLGDMLLIHGGMELMIDNSYEPSELFSHRIKTNDDFQSDYFDLLVKKWQENQE